MVNAPSINRRVSQRGTDWRFLLPDPPEGRFQHLVLLGGPTDLAEHIVEIGLARRVSCEIPRERSADAVIILHNARPALRDIAGCLLPSGVLYYELERRLASFLSSMPGRIRRSLQNVGLSPMGIYWTVPNCARCQMYLPLDFPGPLRWYLRTFRPATTPAQRLLEPVLRTLASLGNLRFAALTPSYAITAIAGPTPDALPSMLGHAALPPELRRSDLRPVVLAGGEDIYRRLALLPFAPGVTEPIAVIKFWRIPDRNRNIEIEQTVLTELRSVLDETMRPSIPRPLGTLRWNQINVGIESYAPGRSLLVSSGRWGAPLRQKIDDLHLVAAWLAEFHHQAQISRLPWSASELHQWIESPLAAYKQAFGVTPGEERFFAEVRKRAASLVGTPVPVVWLHWDFNVRNIWRADHRITVIDWPGGETGPPLFDLLYFVMLWNDTVRGLDSDAARLRGFRELFIEPKRGDKIVSAVHTAIAWYMARVNIDRRFFPLLLTYTLVALAIYQGDRAARSERFVNARWDNIWIKYLGALSENDEQIFAETYGA